MSKSNVTDDEPGPMEMAIRIAPEEVSFFTSVGVEKPPPPSANAKETAIPKTVESKRAIKRKRGPSKKVRDHDSE